MPPTRSTCAVDIRAPIRLQHIIPTLAFMGLLIALASAIDRVMDKESKRILGTSIKDRIVGHRYDIGEVRNPISFIERVRPFSFRSAVISALFSVIALLIVLYVQYFALDYDFKEIFEGVREKDGNLFLAFTLYMILENVIVDYISFTQTLVIIRLINKTDSKKSLFILLFTDLLASINIFTFAYSFFLVLGVLHILNYEERATFVVSFEETEMKPTIQKMISDLGFPNAGRFKHVSTLRINALVPDGPSDLSEGYILSAEAPKPDEMFPMMKAALQRQFPDSSVDLTQETGTVALYKTFPDLKTDYVFKGAMNYLLNATGFFGDWFSVGYLLTDDVQDNFFSVTGLSPGFQKIDRLRYEANERVVDVSLRDFVINWCPKDQTNRDVSDTSCPTGFAYVTSNFPTLDTKLAVSTNIGGKLPLYTFFFTSLSLTLVIYLFYRSVYVFRIASLAAGKLSLPFVKFGNFEEHPITLLSVPVILLAGALYLLLSL